MGWDGCLYILKHAGMLEFHTLWRVLDLHTAYPMCFTWACWSHLTKLLACSWDNRPNPISYSRKCAHGMLNPYPINQSINQNHFTFAGDNEIHKNAYGNLSMQAGNVAARTAEAGWRVIHDTRMVRKGWGKGKVDRLVGESWVTTFILERMQEFKVTGDNGMLENEVKSCFHHHKLVKSITQWFKIKASTKTTTKIWFLLCELEIVDWIEFNIPWEH